MLSRVFVWSGGALFVGALAYCAWTFAVTWGRTAPLPVSAGAVSIDVALFTLFATHHSLFAREAVKARLARVLPRPVLPSLFVWIASLLLIAVCAAWRPVGGGLYETSGAAAAILTGVQLGGLAVIAAAVRIIDPLELAGIRRNPGAAIAIAGPYRWVRHPIYLGWLMGVFGTPAMTGDRLVFAIVSTAYLIVAIAWEERSLARAAGAAYSHYRQQVRWRLIPFVY